MRLIVAVCVTALLLLPVTTVAANAVPMKAYSSCVALLKDYPAGVAKNKRSADRAVASGQRRPPVRPKVYRENSNRLDRDKDGVVCEQQAVAQESAPVLVSGVFFVPTGIPLLDSLYRIRAENGTITQEQSNFVTAWVNTMNTQNWRLICGNWGIDAFKEGFLNTSLRPEVLEVLRLTGQEAWARENASLVTSMFCVSKGYSYP